MVSDRIRYKKIDWVLVICYLILSIFGWLNIYASVYDPEVGNIFSLSLRSGNQFIWMCFGFLIAIALIFFISPRFYLGLSWWIYAFVILLLVLVLIIGKEVNGSQSWFVIGPLRFQPSEISKISTSLVLAVIMGQYGFKINNPRDLFKVLLIIFIPIGLIALEPDAGTILVYCGLIFMLYREGLSGWTILIAALMVLLFVVTLKFSPFVAILVLIGILSITYGILSKKTLLSIINATLFITAASFLPKLLKWDFIENFNRWDVEYWLLAIVVAISIILLIRALLRRNRYMRNIIICFLFSIVMIFSVELIFEKALKTHHRDRIENLLGITEDLQGAGYNVNQSKIAIGSGGVIGKGFLQGTQTKFKFVPEQSTDFIFCTIGEEWGFIGSLAVILIFLTMIIRIIGSAEKQKDAVNRIYGYCVASILFIHIFVNIGMTLGIMPVVGIPLPFISYGGSSFITFTILLFIFIRLDLERWK